ncbi:MAG: septation protein SepH, partial [Actinomycetota bacterium]|nr:septation protein SepH [Actinomycetota bacterium]
MQQLHLVGFTTDLEGLIFSPRKGAKSGGYLVVLDDQLLDSIEDAQRLRDERDNPASPGVQVDAASPEPAPVRQRPKPHSELSPREIQARLRAGASVPDVARAAGVDEEWVLRFATPILAEQARVVERAQQLTFVKTRLGPSSQPLGTSVQWNLAEKGVHLSDDEYDAGWSAFNLHGTTWVVRFSFWSRKRTHTAEWEVELRTAELTSRSRLASDLGYVEPGRGRKRPASPEPGAGRESAARPSDAVATKRATAAKKAAPAKRGAGGTKKTAPTKAAKKSAHGGPGPLADTGDNGSAASAPGEPLEERPTHLARPPSPMNAANRVPVRGRPAGAAFVPPAPVRRAEGAAGLTAPPSRPQSRPPRSPVSRAAPPPGPDGDRETMARPERRPPPPPLPPEAESTASPERRPPPPPPPPPPEPEATASP